MSLAAPTHPLAALAVQLSTAAELDPEALALLQPAQGPREFLDALAQTTRHPDALKFLAHLLPRREAVWWAWMCARLAPDPAAPPAAQAALDATERWIAQPSEENRRAAMRAAEAATFATPAGCAALAAFLSGGSVAPASAPEVPPPPFAAARAIFGSLVLSAVSHQPEQAPERFALFLRYGLELAERIRLWSALPHPAAPTA